MIRVGSLAHDCNYDVLDFKIINRLSDLKQEEVTKIKRLFALDIILTKMN